MDTLTLKLSREILLSSCWENFKNVAKSLYVISKNVTKTTQELSKNVTTWLRNSRYQFADRRLNQ